MTDERAWWKECVVYQIYPRSFQDSNGDGIGDLNGILSRLDYLQLLGVDVLWLSPIYSSPNDDNGYDIRDYQAIMEEFGTMEDFDHLLEAVHQRGMKLVMDLVVNHTSDEHHWFQESRKSTDNPYREYYIWKKGTKEETPNNWASRFRGRAWTYDETTGMYYLHIYSPKQPDLNWENPKVRQEIYQMMKWWGDKGIDGFRMDVISMLSKDPRYPDGEIKEGNPYGDGQPYYTNGPRIHEFLAEMNREVLSRFDWLTVGEGVGVSVDEAMDYAGFSRKELQMMFHFEHLELNPGPYGKWNNNRVDLIQLKQVLSKWQTRLEGKAWNSIFWENHDYPRAVSRFGDDRPAYRELSAKMLAVCLYLMKGTPYIYQGQELGMTNCPFFRLEDYRDIEIHRVYHEMVEEGPLSHEEMMTYIHHTGRDNARTPMQWDDTEYAGFTTGTPWIPVNPNYPNIHAKDQISRPDSVFSFYRRLLCLRRSSMLIQYGTYELCLPDHPALFVYRRKLDGQELLVACNFSDQPQEFTLRFGSPSENVHPEPTRTAELFISNYPDNGDKGMLRPYEAAAYLYFSGDEMTLPPRT